MSRRFVTATAERLAELCARPLDECRWPIVMLEGLLVGEHLLVVALDVTDDGTKVPLGAAPVDQTPPPPRSSRRAANHDI